MNVQPFSVRFAEDNASAATIERKGDGHAAIHTEDGGGSGRGWHVDDGGHRGPHVIGIMAAMLTPMVLNYIDDAKLSKAEEDVKHFPLYTDGTKTTGTPDFDLLRGPGNPPLDNDDASQKWLTGTAAELENHLVKNAPGGTKYLATGRNSWKGPYVERLTEDPWGNQYLINIKGADPGNTQAKVVWVLSSGPNGKIETGWDVLADSGPAPGGDDIVVRVK